MIVLANWLSKPGSRTADRRCRGGALALALLVAAPANAQISGSVSLESDYRLRGYSLSAGRPVATADLGYDHSSGIYVNGSAILVVPGDAAPSVLGGQVNVGYAARIASRVSIDAGIVRSEYTASSSMGYAGHYTEAYLGVATHGISSRVSFSPDYFGAGHRTLYVELEAVLHPAPKWAVSGHVGRLTYLNGAPPYYSSAVGHDWRLGVSRRTGPVEWNAALSGGGPGRDYYRHGYHGRTAFVVGASLTF